jgi:hypothetical protein
MKGYYPKMIKLSPLNILMLGRSYLSTKKQIPNAVIISISVLALAILFLLSGFYPRHYSIIIVAMIILIIWIAMRYEVFYDQVSGVVAEKANTDYLKSIEVIQELVLLARNTIKIVTGNLCHNIYEDSRIIFAFRKAVERHIAIIILYDGDIIDLETKYLLQLARDSKISINKITTKAKCHFIVIDDNHVRIEVDHKARKAEIRFYTSFLSNKASNYFAILSEKIEIKEDSEGEGSQYND